MRFIGFLSADMRSVALVKTKSIGPDNRTDASPRCNVEIMANTEFSCRVSIVAGMFDDHDSYACHYCGHIPRIVVDLAIEDATVEIRIVEPCPDATSVIVAIGKPSADPDAKSLALIADASP